MALTRPRYSTIIDTDWKTSVRAATTGSSITLSGSAPNTLDGVTLALNDRILVKDQSTANQNGIYRVATLGSGSNGTWVRAYDANAAISVTSGQVVPVTEGTLNGGHIFLLSTPDPITLDSTSLTYVSAGFNSAGINSITNTNVSTSTTTGALTVAGGVGIAGNIYVGANANVTGNVNVTGNILSPSHQNGNSSVNIAANANVTITAKSNATVVVTDTGANISGTANITGNANVGNLGTATAVIATGNITTINSGLLQNGTSNVTLASGGNISTFIGGNATAQLVVTATGANIPGTANVGNLGTATAIITTGNITTINSGLLQNGNSNIAITANSNVTISSKSNATLVITDTGANVSGTANISGNANVGNLGTTGLITASGNVTGGNLVATNNLQVNGNNIKSSTGNAAITLSDKDVTIVGNLTVQGSSTTLNTATLDVTDLNITVAKGAATAAAANGAGLTIDGASATLLYISTSNTWVFDRGLTVNGIANITGNANVGNLGTAQVLASANITSPQLISNVTTGTAPLVVTSTTQVANLNAALAGNAVNLNNGTSNVVVTSSGNITVGSAGNAAILTVTGTGANITGTANVSGNANVGNLNASNVVASSGFTMGSQVFYAQGTNGFSVNENFDPSNNSGQTAYHFASGATRANIAFTLARTGQFTDGFGVYGTSADNTFVTFGEQSNTSFEWRKGIGIQPLNLSGGTQLMKLSSAGNLVIPTATASASNTTGALVVGGGVGITGNINLVYNPVSAIGSAVNLTGKDTQGGTGWFDFLKATNTTSGATNPNKTFRLNSTGGLEVINNAYSATLLTLTDAGALSVASTMSSTGFYVNNKQAVNGPAFRAYIDGSQTISSGSQQKVTFGTETFDTNSNFSSSRFTPNVEGYYQLNATVRISGPSSTGECMLIIWKNGSEYSRGTNESGTEQGASFYSMQVSDIAYANGSSDYFEIYIQQVSGSNRDTTSGQNISYFSGAMVRGA